MRLTQHPTNNDVLKAPPGTPHDQCVSAPITRYFYTTENRYGCRTYWRPSDEERNAIAQGKDVWLEVWGESMPPSCIGVDGINYEEVAK